MKKRKVCYGIIVSLLIMALLSSRMRNFLVEFGYFFTSFIKNPATVGSVMPSSPALAEEIIRYIDTKKRAVKILEVGAGTGVFTQEIAKKMGPDDHLDIIEIDPSLCAMLEVKFIEYKNITVHCMSILDWHPPYVYDFIVSGLPFNAFKADFVDEILKTYITLIKPGGILSYFEYIVASDIKKLFLKGEEKRDYLKNLALTSQFIKDFFFDIDMVFLNIPPTYVYHLKIKKNGD